MYVLRNRKFIIIFFYFQSLITCCYFFFLLSKLSVGSTAVAVLAKFVVISFDVIIRKLLLIIFRWKINQFCIFHLLLSEKNDIGVAIKHDLLYMYRTIYA